MGILTQSALASETLKFTKTTEAKMAADLDFCKSVSKYNDKLIPLLNTKVEKYFILSEDYRKKTLLLEQDKTDLKLRGDKFEKVYTTCNDDLNKCEQSKPSRMVWYGAGFVSAIVLGIVAVYTIKK